MNQPLVSVSVITYNSSEYIIEGLESIKNQTYQNIELIISDDCSTDNTVEICRDWIEKNRERFVRTLLVTTDKNTGVAGNCNRAIQPAKGEWIKMLSGDDKFLPNTIEDYIKYVLSNPKIKICFAELFFVGEDRDSTNQAKQYYKNIYKYIRDYENQKREYIKHHFIPATGLFFKKSLWSDIGGFDERYPFCEEYPFNLKVLEKGETIYYLDKELYVYQIQPNSLSNSGSGLNIRTFTDSRKFFKKERFVKIIKKGAFLTALDQYVGYEYLWTHKYGQGTWLYKHLTTVMYLISPKTIIRKIFRRTK